MPPEVASAVLEFMDKILRETGQAKLRLTFHGGEPLMAGHSFFEALLDRIATRFPERQIGLQSNLWLMDDRFCDCMSRHKVAVGTSLDGPEKINDSQRGTGSFARTMAGIRLARTSGLKVSCIATFTRLSVERWEEVFDFFDAHNFTFSLHAAVASLQGKNGLEVLPEQWEEVLPAMLRRYAQERHTLRVEILDQLCRSVVEREGAVCTFRDCFGTFLVIDPAGGIYPCQRMAGMERFRMGSVFDNPSMSDLVASRPARLFLEREERIRDVCKGCAHFDYCMGGCPYNAMAAGEGDKDPLCKAWKGVFDEIITRLSEEMETPGNIALLAERGLRRTGHPLIHSGAIAELSRRDGNPYKTVRNARRVVAAVELARCPDLNRVSHTLVEKGISRSEDSAQEALRRLQAGLDPAGKLYKLYLHVTFRCQLQCTHCYASAGEEDAVHDMAPDDLSSLLSEVADTGFQEIVITGGEPLIHREIDRVLRILTEARRSGENPKLVLRTNFSMPLTRARMDSIAAAFDQVVVSVDGPQQLHDARRGTGAFERLHRNLVVWMRDIDGRPSPLHGGRGARLNLAASLSSKDAQGEVGRAIWAIADRLGIRHVKMRPLLPLGRARNWDEPPTTEVLHMNIAPWEVLEQGFQPCASCGIGQNLYVEPDGKVFPCYAYHGQHSVLGNIFREGLSAVIDSEGFQALATKTVDTNSRCRSCDMRYICGGACRAWSEDSAQFDLDAAPANCAPLKERAELIYKEALDYLGLSS